MTKTLTRAEPALTPPPAPSRPPRVTEADRESALIQIMAGESLPRVRARAAEAAERAAALAAAMAELEGNGWTQQAALAAVRANGGTACGALERAAA